jgi:hypothetical protein
MLATGQIWLGRRISRQASSLRGPLVKKIVQSGQRNQGAVVTPGTGTLLVPSLESRAAMRVLSDTDLRNPRISPELLEAIASPLIWLTRHTRTRDSHWREAGTMSPYRPFPDKPYFASLLDIFQADPVIFVEKSRDMMLSWLSVGYLTHRAMTNPQFEVLFQSQKEDKAAELVQYAKTLYAQQDEALKRRFPLAKLLREQASLKLEFANGSRIIGIPEGADQIRSYHPWGLLMDEAAFQPEAGEAYDAAVPVCQKIIVVSSAGPGWFADFLTEAL